MCFYADECCKPNICSQLTPQCNNLHQSLHWIKQVNWRIQSEINSLFPYLPLVVQHLDAGSFLTQFWRGWEAKGGFIVRLTPRSSQCHRCQTWMALGPLAPAMLSLQLMAGAQHGTGLGLQVTETGPRARQLLQNKPALHFFVRVWVLSMSWGWSSAKSLCQGAPKLGCSFLQPGMAWKAWGAGVAGLRKDSISTEDQ